MDFDSFCSAEYPRLVGTITLFCGDSAVAEELAQETLIRAFQHWKRVEELDNPGAWENRVALYLATSYFRRKRAERRARGHLESSVPDRYEEPEIEIERAQEVRRILLALPRRQRTVLILRYYVGLSVGEVAHEMQCPEGSVKRLAHEAIRSVRASTTVDEFKEVVRDGT